MGNALKMSRPWDFLPDEHSKAREGWVIYREMAKGQRSTNAVAKALGKPPSTIRVWCNRFEWIDRVALYDKHCDAQRRRALEQDSIRDARRQRKIVSQIETLSTTALDNLITLMKGGDGDGCLSPRDTLKAAELAVKLRRLISGQSTENHQLAAPVDLTCLTDDELAALDNLTQKATFTLPPKKEH